MISKQPFGRTGHESTRVVFGGASLSKVTQDEADKTLEVLLRYGVNHLDLAAGYGDAELRVAPWLRKYPDRFFLATKTGLRTYDDAKRQIHHSLERLGVERVDLIQLHSLADPIEWDTALSPGSSRSLRGSAGTGVGAVHRRHRPWYPDRSHPSSQLGAFRL